MKCTYTRNGRKYSKEGILKALSNDLNLGVSARAREFLRVKLGMDDSEVEIVASLIDGKSLGRFKADGRILLSAFADDSVAYHEAFHRVFRMYLKPGDRSQYYNQVTKEQYEPYRELYPNNTVEELKEEYLADQFADYIINKGDIKTDKVTRTLFDKIIDFVKKLLGLKPKSIQDLYNQIQQGKFNGRPFDKKYQYARSADKVTIGNNTYSSDIKNEFVQGLTRLMVNELISQNSMYDFIRNNVPEGSFDDLYKSLHTFLVTEIAETNPDLATDLLDDDDLGKQQSYIFQQFKQYIETLIGKINLTEKQKEKVTNDVQNEVEEGERVDFVEEGVGEETQRRQQDDIAWKASFEIDPKTTMSKAIKLILASFEDTRETNALGFAKQVRWTNAFNKVAKHLAGVPTSDSIEHLSKLNEPWAEHLVEYLGGINPDPATMDANMLRLRNEFIRTFAKTEHNYVIVEVNDDGLKWFDANQDTGKKKVVKQWKNNMLLAIKTQADSFEDWVAKLDTLINSKNVSAEEYEQLLGISVDDDLKNQPLFRQDNTDYYYWNAMNAISKYIIKSVKSKKFSNEAPPDYNKIFDKNNLDIEGTIEKMADAQLEYEDAVDLMLFSRDKKLYGISLNTHTTNTINTLNYVATLIDPAMSLDERLAVIDKYLPDILNYQTIDRVKGEYIVKSEWLKNILDGNKIQMVIIDGMTSATGENDATADLNESDLYAMTFNLSLNGVNISIKHSDRSVFYGYKMEKAKIFDYQEKNTQNENEVVSYLTSVLQDQLATEVRRANLSFVPLISYFKNKYRDSMLFGELKNIANLDPYSKDVEKIVRSNVSQELAKYKSELAKWGVINADTKQMTGVDPSMLTYHNNDVNLMIASSFANQMLSHLEEVRNLIGDFAFFKTADDFYKRMSTTSGTGESLVNDEVTNARIANMNNRSFQIYNPKLGTEAEAETIKYDKTIDGTFTSLTLFEKKDYQSPMAHNLTQTSLFNGEKISDMQYLFEWNALRDKNRLVEELGSSEKAKIVELSKAYAEAYQSINENDGQSWMNMFMYREYIIRLGQWSDEMNNLFLAELQILNARSDEDIKNAYITVGGVRVPLFDWKNWKEGYFDSVNTLKSQYAGPSKSFMEYRDATLKNFNERIRPYTIYKTSYHALWPSVIHGTNLAQMHYFMIKNKIDTIHMESANKTGAIDVQSVFNQYDDSMLTSDQKATKQNGFNFYDTQGLFNDSIFEGELGANALIQSLVSSNINSLKDQVKIGNHEKTEIKGSTQSLKILLSNLIVNGQPRFEGADVLAQQYKDVVKELVVRAINKLKSEIGFDGDTITKLDELVDLIKRAAADRSSPVNTIEAIEGFLYDPHIETLPNRSKLENIFYSIITNNVVSFNRPGNSYPQAASTGFEPLGSRNVLDAKLNVLTNDDLVKFYTIETNEAGDITKVNPAEIIMPLPKAWIKELLIKAKTDNLVEALDWLNTRIADGRISNEVTFKALRIPNQQLSSNDIMKVKKFHLPTNVNYVIIPSEMVAKTGGDYDIDKLNIYWADSNNLFENKHSDMSIPFEQQTETELQSSLLQLEQKILLHPRNAHMLLMPIIDDLLKNDAYREVAVGLKGLPAKDPTTFLQSLTPHKNVEKSIDFVKSKFGVGVVALDITGHAIFMVDHINLSQSYNNANEKKAVSTQLRFDGLRDNYSLSSMYDQSDRIISEIQSQLMNSQVDAGKDPYAVKLGISNQTLNMVLYLNRRGVPIKTALKFVNQPLIQEYLIAQRNNESIINKQRGDELTKIELVNEVLTKNGYRPVSNSIFEYDRPGLNMTDNMLNAGIKGDNSRQLEMFSYFLRLVDEVSAFNDLKNSLTVDTKGKKDKSAVEAWRELQAKVAFQQIIPKESHEFLMTKGLLAPFHDAQDLYQKFYDPFYALQQSAFGTQLTAFKKGMADKQRGEFKKEKVRKAIDSDFMLFLIQNYNSDFSLDKFNTLFGLTGDTSLAEEIRELQKDERYANNPVLKAFFPLISIAKDEVNNKTFDALRLFERELTTIDVNDFIDSMKDIRDEISEDLYKSIVHISLSQAGFLNSPFSLAKVLPTFDTSTRNAKGELVNYTNDYLREIQLESIQTLQSGKLNPEILFPIFEQLFYLNNPEFLPKRFFKSSTIPYYNIYDKTQKKRVLKYILDAKTPSVVIQPLGNTYMKRYFAELHNAAFLPTLTTESNETVEPVTPPSVISTIGLTQPFTRQSVEADKEYIYLFTDNAGRTSGNNPIPQNTPYSNKYGNGLKYPTITQAVIRGLVNAYPITTMVDDRRTQWTDAGFEKYSKIIDSEIDDIKAALASGSFKGIKYSDLGQFGKGNISNMKNSAPKLWDYMNQKLLELGIDNRDRTTENKSKTEFAKVTEDPFNVASFFEATDGMTDDQKAILNQAFQFNSNDAEVTCNINIKIAK